MISKPKALAPSQRGAMRSRRAARAERAAARRRMQV